MSFQNKNKNRRNTFEHYAVYLALVISLLTAFLLGLVLSDTLLGTGFTYFSDMRDQASFQKTPSVMQGNSYRY